MLTADAHRLQSPRPPIPSAAAGHSTHSRQRRKVRRDGAAVPRDDAKHRRLLPSGSLTWLPLPLTLTLTFTLTLTLPFPLIPPSLAPPADFWRDMEARRAAD